MKVSFLCRAIFIDGSNETEIRDNLNGEAIHGAVTLPGGQSSASNVEFAGCFRKVKAKNSKSSSFTVTDDRYRLWPKVANEPNNDQTAINRGSASVRRGGSECTHGTKYTIISRKVTRHLFQTRFDYFGKVWQGTVVNERDLGLDEEGHRDECIKMHESCMLVMTRSR